MRRGCGGQVRISTRFHTAPTSPPTHDAIVKRQRRLHIQASATRKEAGATAREHRWYGAHQSGISVAATMDVMFTTGLRDTQPLKTAGNWEHRCRDRKPPWLPPNTKHWSRVTGTLGDAASTCFTASMTSSTSMRPMRPAESRSKRRPMTTALHVHMQNPLRKKRMDYRHRNHPPSPSSSSPSSSTTSLCAALTK